jgi:site-specific recombinase XerD
MDQPHALVSLEQIAGDYVRAAKAPNTLRAYQSDWATFTAWCIRRGDAALPAAAETLALYLADRAATGAKPSSLQRALAAISQAHQAKGLTSPTSHAGVRAVMAGIRRTHGTAPAKKAPMLPDTLRRVSPVLAGDLRGHRDRALLLLGFAAALRRSELAGLDVSDVEPSPSGLVVRVRRSKTDQDSQGRAVGVPYGSTPEVCPVRAVAAWQTAAGVTEGPLFRTIDRHGRLGTAPLSDRAVARAVQRAARATGLDPSRFGGHSLRAGLATAAAAAGVEERDIARQTGHRSMAVLRGYIREGELFRRNAAAAVL